MTRQECCAFCGDPIGEPRETERDPELPPAVCDDPWCRRQAALDEQEPEEIEGGMQVRG